MWNTQRYKADLAANSPISFSWTQWNGLHIYDDPARITPDALHPFHPVPSLATLRQLRACEEGTSMALTTINLTFLQTCSKIKSNIDLTWRLKTGPNAKEAENEPAEFLQRHEVGCFKS
ncbi:hypothetical protein NPIL_185291 [Nephila pilipes]|uniref:Uncharacterized protein n=1 Tax=Nephila pilipes TaxID=299642 RepID=A0A8X6QMM0_NEPPI|nr:hypothetical protein NPIL_185291 [Nephila pilipes]